MANYGSLADIAAIVPRYADAAGEFTAATRPTETQVTTHLTQVSAMLDGVLANEGFSTPVTEETVTPMLDAFVNQEVADIVEGVNGSGRFGPRETSEGGGAGRFAIINADLVAFISSIRTGLVRMGASMEDTDSVGGGWYSVSAERDDGYANEGETSTTGAQYTT